MANSNESKFLVCQELSDFNDFLLILGSNSPNYCLIMGKNKGKRQVGTYMDTECQKRTLFGTGQAI